jgi:protein TonB
MTSCGSTKSTARDGFVQMSFDINEQGEPGNIKVLISEPDNRYDEQAIETLSKWKYNPKMVDGVATYQKALTVQLDFHEGK